MPRATSLTMTTFVCVVLATACGSGAVKTVDAPREPATPSTAAWTPAPAHEAVEPAPAPEPMQPAPSEETGDIPKSFPESLPPTPPNMPTPRDKRCPRPNIA